MRTVRDQIITAAIAVLNTSAPIGIPAADRLRMESYEPSELPAMNVFPVREEVKSEAVGRWGPIVTRSMTMRVILHAAGSDTVSADKALDPLAAWVSTLGGQQFGGLALDTEESSLEWLYDDEDLPYSSLAIDFRVDYKTLKADATKTG